MVKRKEANEVGTTVKQKEASDLGTTVKRTKYWLNGPASVVGADVKAEASVVGADMKATLNERDQDSLDSISLGCSYLLCYLARWLSNLQRLAIKLSI